MNTIRQPHIVTRKHSVEEYRRLKRRDREVLTVDEFTDEDIEALEKTRAPAEAAAFNHEVTD